MRSTSGRWLQFLWGMGLAIGMSVSGSWGQEVEWQSFEKAVAVADSTDRFLMVAVYAPWCGWCHKMKKEVYPSVRRCLTSDFVITRLNRDDTETMYRYQGRRVTPRRLASTFQVDGVPATVLLSPRGEYLLHLSGFIEPESLRAVLGFVSTRAYRQMTFAEYRARMTAPCE